MNWTRVFTYAGWFALGGAYHAWKGSEAQAPLLLAVLMFTVAICLSLNRAR